MATECVRRGNGVWTETPFSLRQLNYLGDRRVEIEAIALRRRFLDVISDPIDDVSGSIGIGHNTAQRFSDFAPVPYEIQQKLARELHAVEMA